MCSITFNELFEETCGIYGISEINEIEISNIIMENATNLMEESMIINESKERVGFFRKVIGFFGKVKGMIIDAVVGFLGKIRKIYKNVKNRNQKYSEINTNGKTTTGLIITNCSSEIFEVLLKEASAMFNKIGDIIKNTSFNNEPSNTDQYVNQTEEFVNEMKESLNTIENSVDKIYQKHTFKEGTSVNSVRDALIKIIEDYEKEADVVKKNTKEEVKNLDTATEYFNKYLERLEQRPEEIRLKNGISKEAFEKISSATTKMIGFYCTYTGKISGYLTAFLRKYTESYTNASNAMFSGTMDEDINVDKQFKKIVKEGKKSEARVLMRDSLNKDRSTVTFRSMYKYALKHMKDLLDEHDEEKFKSPKEWTKEYYEEQMQKLLSNFSKERINILLKMTRKLFK